MPRFAFSAVVMSFLLLAACPPATGVELDAELLGKSAGYPIGTPANWFFDERVRVGSFSNLDKVLSHNVLPKSAIERALPNAAGVFNLTYQFQNQTSDIERFLEHQRITGLLIIKDGRVLVERYQYGRKASDRFVSHSIAKSIVSLAVGFALAEGKIASLDDKVAKYVTELGGVPYGDASIRNTLRMSSGVKFNEVYDGKDDLARFAGLRRAQGSIAALRGFTIQETAAGSRFKYASSETVVLGTLIRAVTGETISRYLTTRLWQPMGAESDATWIKGADGLETASGSFNAVLRDYGRLGMLLADDGKVDGTQILPAAYLLEATDWHRQPEAFAPRRATPYFGYGYQFWTYPGERRRFALLGVYGQSIFVDPGLKLVMVITAAAKNATVGKETFAAERDAVWRGLVQKFGTW